MENPFQYGVLVDNEYFTDRINELKEVQQSLNSANHLILISPRRFGKSSLVAKAVKASSRPCVSLNMQNVLSVEDLSSKTISSNPVTNVIDVSFQPVVNNLVLLEDAMALLEKVSTEGKRLIVVFDEFQEILNIRKGLDKQLRSIMQEQQNLNYILLGSQESMMTEIFERKKSPFYHFGKLMRLDKIPYDDFRNYISTRLPLEDKEKLDTIVDEILSFTNLHPYYTQQLSAEVWDMLTNDNLIDGVVVASIKKILRTHDLDYERLWLNFNRTDRSIMLSLSKGTNPMQNRQMATSTSYSAIKRLTKSGYIIRVNDYEIEDPFFKEWMIINCQ